MASLFISYSHHDESIVQNLEKHFVMLKREGLLSTWYDKDILAGSEIDNAVFNELEQSNIFLAVISPDYLVSNYCYEKELKRALAKQTEGKLTILPIIAEHCDWKQSPFGKLKALPKDGKPLSDWVQPNVAYQFITEELRRLLTTVKKGTVTPSAGQSHQPVASNRNYKIKQDFTEIDKLSFKEQSFNEILAYFTSAIDELDSLDDVQARFIRKDDQSFSAIISNRKKINATGYVSVNIETGSRHSFRGDLGFSFSEHQNPNSVELDKIFNIGQDDYELFWTSSMRFFPSQSSSDQRLSATSIAELIWKEFIKQVGLSY